MDRKTIIAFILVGIVIIFMPYYQQMVNPQEATPAVQQEADKAEDTYIPEEPREPVKTEPKIKTRDISVESKEVVIVNDKYAMVLSNLGGGTVRGYQLYEYEGPDGDPVQLIPEDASANLNISYTNIYQDVSDLENRAFDCAQLDNMESGDTLFVKHKNTLSYTIETEEGIQLEKRFTFYPHRYDFNMDVIITDYLQKMAGLKYTVAWNDGFAITENNVSDDIMYSAVYAQMGYELVKQEMKKVKNGEAETIKTNGQTDWLLFKSKYFSGFIAPRDEKGIRSELMLYKEDDKRDFTARIDMGLSKSNYQKNSFLIGLVPTEKALLSSYDMEFEKTMNWGGKIIKPFSIALHWLLEFFYRLIPNYGVVILVISVVIKIITYPLTHKSYSSMKRMQLVQPKIKELQEKYKNNKQVLQQKTMELYKKEKVNPMGGCLPMLLQLPLLYGLFIVFRTAIEFRGAPFMLWIQDLSAPDAMFSFGMNIPLLGSDFNLLPVLMTVLMVVQQKMSGNTNAGTPQQAQQQKMMMWLMPGMLFFLFYNFPSGLVLYYLTFNALTILQQKFIINKQVEESFSKSHPENVKAKSSGGKKRS
ncbi:MAG: membrane protein insertase YidC [Candidatus Marinimicrobia bacterium]|nr:membrane protein insertase YidC [Candidatus Neomarinimicrobiota bacterium]